MFSGQSLFLIMVFAAVVLAAYALVVPSLSGSRSAQKRMQKRLKEVGQSFEGPSSTMLLRDKYLRDLSPLEAWLESLPGLEGLAAMIEQSGRSTPAYRVVLLSIVLLLFGAAAGWVFTRQWIVVVALALIGFAVPIVVVMVQRGTRLAKFEEQMPSALDIMSRSLRAGHPFVDSMRMVGEEMPNPMGAEFAITFNDMNYGSDARVALLNMLARVPSVNLLAMVTSVLIQRETGGNLAELLDNISTIVRSRFKFQRKVRSMSAEGRLSGWVLAMVPFGLVALLSFTTPDYLPLLLEDPFGQSLIKYACGLFVVGLFWMRKIIRIDV